MEDAGGNFAEAVRRTQQACIWGVPDATATKKRAEEKSSMMR
jgi:hypothetical protein